MVLAAQYIALTRIIHDRCHRNELEELLVQCCPCVDADLIRSTNFVNWPPIDYAAWRSISGKPY